MSGDDRFQQAQSIWDMRDARREIRALRWLVISQIVVLLVAIVVVGVIIYES
tara:strand:- start:64 stop:219 length:156 start_codon:yes stop_codon:yes gene_type:complete